MRPQLHRLFFALRPGATLVHEIERAAEVVKAPNLVRGKWLKAPKFHVTVHFLGDFLEPADVIARASNAGANVRFAPFEFVLDRAASLPRRFNPPCVLRCTPDSEEILHSFWRELGNALSAAGLRERLERRFIPHLTIAYANDALTEPIKLEPIVWKASDFSLMDSPVGQSTHSEIGRWDLRTD
jgi:2'-5' RNA ligase